MLALKAIRRAPSSIRSRGSDAVILPGFEALADENCSVFGTEGLEGDAVATAISEGNAAATRASGTRGTCASSLASATGCVIANMIIRPWIRLCINRLINTANQLPAEDALSPYRQPTDSGKR